MIIRFMYIKTQSSHSEIILLIFLCHLLFCNSHLEWRKNFKTLAARTADLTVVLN